MKPHESKRFKDIQSFRDYFEEAGENSALVDALLFLASEVGKTNDSLEHLWNDYTGYDP